MTQSHRLPSGGRIDRAKPLRFTFNGRGYEGYAGDTLASALLANDVKLVARSFKYHRPRGILTAGAEEPNALVQLEAGARTEPNLRATQVELHDGLVAASVNAWPSVDFDLGAINGALSRLFVAGFYYKTFMHPKALWDRLYEPSIRRMAGMGKAPTAPDPDIYDRMHLHCDVLVIGGGPAGLAAALAAGRAKARVVLVDEQAELGGALLSSREPIDGKPAMDWVGRVAAELGTMAEVVLLPRATAFGYYDHSYVSIVERRTDHRGGAAGQTRQRLWHVRARRVVLATGAHERPLVFAHNDRPGVMLASAVRSYINRYGVRPGARGIVVTNNDSAYQAAFDLRDSGAEVPAIIDLRPTVRDSLAMQARQRSIDLLLGHAVLRCGRAKAVAGVEVAPLAASGESLAGQARSFDCDLVAMSGGWSPAVHLFSQSQGKLRFDEAKACFVPDRSAQAEQSVGAANGTFDLAGCIAEGLAAGARAAALSGFGDGKPPEAPAIAPEESAPLRALWVVPATKPKPGAFAKHFVDFQNDVTAGDILMASREGLHSVEHVKRYTTTGMGTDQGKTSNVNALAILSRALDREVAATGTTTFRPPYTPVAYGALAGRDVGELSDPVRMTPIHAWHVEHGAVFEDVGQWKRPYYYPRAGETMAAVVRRECLAVREAVGIMDVSTLGKIDIQGPDAAEFLDRVYANNFRNLGIGRCRYGLMCKLDGMVFDDGVSTRLGPNHFLMNTTTGGAARVLDWLEEWLQTEWPELKVYCASVTEQWATVAIAGPLAREVMRALAPGLALDRDAFPFMTMREGIVAGTEARVARIGFTGELTFEISVPSWHGLALWQAVMAAGEPHGITPFGTEAMHVLRAEKGYIVVGHETDGTVTPQDLGLAALVSKTKDFIGRRSFNRADTRRADRKQLVGLLPDDPREVLPEGAQLVVDPSIGPPTPMIGHVTSSYDSATLGRSFALALVKGGRGRIGETVFVPLEGRTAAARIVKPIFYDEAGARRDG